MTQNVEKSAMVASIQEAYCSYEVSKLLKEKGFNESTRLVWYEHVPSHNVAHKREAGSKKLGYFYWDENTERIHFIQMMSMRKVPEYIKGKVYSAPTHQMAMAWLRENHNLFFGIGFGNDCNGNFLYMVDIYDLTNEAVNGKYKPIIEADDYLTDNPKTYEEAVEAALKYSLENLL